MCVCSKVMTPAGSHHSAGTAYGHAFVSLPRVRCPERALGGAQQPVSCSTHVATTVDPLAASSISCLQIECREEGQGASWQPPSLFVRALARTTISGLVLPGTHLHCAFVSVCVCRLVREYRSLYIQCKVKKCTK